MNKTKKSVVKRFKKTGTGKLLRRKPGKRHFLRRKSTKQRRSMGQDQGMGAGMEARYKQAMPFA
ncbi:MAG: 50S ribosomal protein L35 [Verrucomicrobia bacterium CG_4_10_14_3_um_filter_43_23]|nr:MAG: 50S ribosomal protein L35 [Verrucomicrobia bacterium CG1_02_43_26]PIP58630.1 MAG: 50S ribosomal protein L35 [Verrucomicrobia bacterium CG22_combo_CG10-13_8_21_14_all_43_17]PIX58386.1 MAG: 50S ribosomal protein L35 [Verrucomicrobia bacterium CG_4_10_14_3_um_filter_43_23]PIY61224.1 MAG: 50S ribosomal protein L35 [Verrucomicrobia bacterium CG_4_10_14_0_8_um_filter_43_34]PJA44961.1 MAG: 50S ribosomal protein L35 [Verrucomicrobia bacterium CG_4_9_14_3_um_filter_43_20]